LNEIKSDDENFQALKALVDAKEITEVATVPNVDTQDPNFGIVIFFKTTAAENKERDIQNYMKLNNVSRKIAEGELRKLGVMWGTEAVLGWT
jgi:hypothetical protein